MTNRIPNQATSPLQGPRVATARPAPAAAAALTGASDGLALVGRAGPPAIDSARAAEARQAAEALWANQPIAATTASGELGASEAPPTQAAAPAAEATGAWGAAGASVRIVQDLADLDDPRFARVGGAPANKRSVAANNIHWHFRSAGFDGPDGPQKAKAFLDRHADAFAKRIDDLSKADPKAHARWCRVAGPILGLNDAQLNATAAVLFERAVAGNNWGPLEDLGRRASHFTRSKAILGAGEQASALATHANALIKANTPMERQALAALAPGERATYAQLQSTLGEDPHAQLALQLLAIEGRLGVPADGSLIAALGRVAAQRLAPGLERLPLLAALVRETATPTAITQKEDTWTCTVTVAQIALATRRPAEYVRIVSALASPSGRVTLAGGETIERAPGTAGPDLTGRTPSSRLWQAAMMDHANGADRYDPKLDMSTRRNGRTYQGQTDDAAQERLFASLTGKATETIFGPGAGARRASQAAFARVKQAVEDGQKVPASYVVDRNTSHAVLITGIAAGVVTYADPMGLVKHVPEAEFEQKLYDAVVER